MELGGALYSVYMIALTERLAAFEYRYQQEAHAWWTYADSLTWFTT